MENKAAILDEYDSQRKLYESFTLEVEHQLQKILEIEGIVCNAITGRIKERESLGKKIDRKNGKYASLNEITDIAGVRVITYYAEDVDKVADIVEQEFVIDKENSIDKRKAMEPDRFGYCSVHYVVAMSSERLQLRENKKYDGLKCEIQIRSVLQHAWAEIEHDLGYKSEKTIPQDIRRNFSRLAGLLEIADKEFQEIRSFLRSYQEEAIEKVEDGELQGVAIDAILLRAMIESNQDIIELNESIRGVFDGPYLQTLSLELLEITINRLNWLHIVTVSQLKDCIVRNKEDALKIAKYLQESNGEGYHMSIPKTIAFFYLCYAELLREKPDAKRIKEYLVENNIIDPSQGDKNIIQLHNVSKKIHERSL